MRRENLTGLRAIMLAAILIIMISAAEKAFMAASASTPLQEKLQQEAERFERRHLWEENQPGAQYDKMLQQQLTTDNNSMTENVLRSILANDPSRINDNDWRKVALDIISTNNTGDIAKLVIHSDTGWSAVVQDSNFVQRSVDGFGIGSIDFYCGSFGGGGIYSHVVQKSTGHGVLNVYVAQDGRILKQAHTAADYGVVSIAGTCA
jgi:hypothetical protein